MGTHATVTMRAAGFPAARGTAALVLIHAWGVLIRWFVWFRSGGLHRKGGTVDIDNYLAMSRWLWSGDFHDLAQYRPTQLLYPLLLSPIHWFGLSEQIYVLFLHTGLALAMIFCSYRIGEELAGERYGWLVAFLVASFQPTFTFFNWMFTDTLYYTAIIVFVLCTVYCWQKRRVWPLLPVGAFFFFIKPETIAPLAVAVAYRSSRRVVVVMTTTALLCAVIAVSWRPARTAVLSHIHVAHGLWLSTHTVINANGAEQLQAYIEARQLGEYRGQTGNLALSLKALDIIRAHPVRYLLRIPMRWIAVWYPALFHTEASTLWRAKDLALCLFATLGGLLAFFLHSGTRRGIASIGLAMTLFVACYINDGDLRFRIPIMLVFVLVAPLGWHAVYARVTARLRIVPQVSPSALPLPTRPRARC